MYHEHKKQLNKAKQQPKFQNISLHEIKRLYVLIFSDSNPRFLFSDTQKIIILDTETGEEIIVAEGYTNVLFVVYHQSKDLIFWSDYSGGNISRFVN